MTLSAAVSTLGLLQGSTAVVIGAMLISPLMGPIMALGFGLATIESVLIKRSLMTLAAGIALAVVVAAVLIWLSPIRDVTEEMRARTAPNLLDLAVAVVGGVAGVYAIMRQWSGVMVGVAIATALVPPLSTVGFGLVTARTDFALGAALLFLTNTLAIALAATGVARLNRFGPSLTPQHTVMQVVGIVAVLSLLSIPLALSLDKLVRQAGVRRAVQNALVERLGGASRIDGLEVTIRQDAVAIDGVVLVARYDAALDDWLRSKMREQLGAVPAVKIVQIRQEDSAASDAQRRLAERIAALEASDAETGAILRSLEIGTLVPRSQVLLDPQMRQIVLNRPDPADAEAADAFVAVLAKTRAAFPAWQIDVRTSARGAPTPDARTLNARPLDSPAR